MTADDIRSLSSRLVEKLVTGYQPQKVILFGSHAYGNPIQESDIDLLIIKDTPERFIDRLATVRHILTDPKRKIALEILVLTPGEIEKGLDRGDQFLGEILEKGLVLYAA